MSAYDLALAGMVVSSDHNVFYGDVVVRRLQLHGEESMDDDVPMLAQSSDKQMASAAGAEDLSWVGRVIDLCQDGYVQVRWGNNATSKVIIRTSKASPMHACFISRAYIFAWSQNKRKSHFWRRFF